MGSIDGAGSSPALASPLLRPLKIGSLEVPGRLFKAASAETRASFAGGFVTDDLLDFYEPMARGGTPLIISGNMAIAARASGLHRETAIDSEEKLPGLRTLAETVHRHGSLIFAQLNHCGRQVMLQPDPVSASGVREQVFGTKPRPMTVAEIGETTEDFARAAERAQRAGFDGVELHMAHGYLISQFLTPHTNRRTDAYGGSFDGRLRIAREVLCAVRERVGGGFPVIAKLNGHDLLPGRAGLKTAELVRIAGALQDEGIDGFEISSCHYESGMGNVRGRFTEFFRQMAVGQFTEMARVRRAVFKAVWPLSAAVTNVAWRYREGFNLEFARSFTEALAVPVICVGGWQHRAGMELAIESGGCDAVSATRAMIADPLLFRHVIELGGPKPACSYCNGCLGRLSYMPIDCYDPAVRAQRDAVLAEEIGWRPRALDMRTPSEAAGVVS